MTFLLCLYGTFTSWASVKSIVDVAKKVSFDQFKAREAGATDVKDSLRSKIKSAADSSGADDSFTEGMYNGRFSDESALVFLDTYKNTQKAHIEFCNPGDYEMRYYTLNEEELSKFMDLMSKASLDRNVSSAMADFTYTLHLFDEEDKYVYVIAVDSDKESMYIEAGGLNCDGLAEFIVSLSDKATALHGEVVYRDRQLHK